MPIHEYIAQVSQVYFVRKEINRSCKSNLITDVAQL